MCERWRLIPCSNPSYSIYTSCEIPNLEGSSVAREIDISWNKWSLEQKDDGYTVF
jgi:hypothetical protein